MTVSRTSDPTPTAPDRPALHDIWGRVLLTVLGGCQLLMAAGAGPLLLAVGGLSGAVLVAAAWAPVTQRVTLLGLALLGTVPFALLAWVAVAPVLVLLAALAIVLWSAGRLPTRRSTERGAR